MKPSYFPKIPAISRGIRVRLENMEDIHAFYTGKTLIFHGKNFLSLGWKIKTSYFAERNRIRARIRLEFLELLEMRSAVPPIGGGSRESSPNR